MTKEGWKELVKQTATNPKQLDLLAAHLAEVDLAKQELRNKGYGWTGLSILETAKTVEACP